MELPTPSLDDRRFQDLVDEAKRFVQQRCPEWTDHNVSDPGVTMIELFASMVEQLIFRLNQVPERNYVKFLDLIGVQLVPPSDAKVDQTFWLSSPQQDVVPIPVGAEVATLRTETEEAVTFTVIEDLDIVPCGLTAVGSSTQPGEVVDHSEDLTLTRRFACFDRQPKEGDALYLGLSRAAPRCAVALHFDCFVEGYGVDPTDPPIVWEAWTGGGWVESEVDHDETGGLNRSGDLVLHLPAGHIESAIAGTRAAWLRCRVGAPEEGQPFYSASPQISGASAATVGGTTRAAHSEVVTGEIVGISEGIPGQRFHLRRTPVVRTGHPLVVQVSGPDGWEEWLPIDGFGECEPLDRRFSTRETYGIDDFSTLSAPAATLPRRPPPLR